MHEERGGEYYEEGRKERKKAKKAERRGGYEDCPDADNFVFHLNRIRHYLYDSRSQTQLDEDDQ